jgi:hypothetical protein
VMHDDEQAAPAALEADAGTTDESAAAHQVELDIAEIRRGLVLLAADVPVPTATRRRVRLIWLAAAAAVALVGAGTLGATALIDREGGGNSGPPAMGMPANPLTLHERVASASRIVVGTVIALQRGRIDSEIEGEAGDPYVLATIRIDEAIKGPHGEIVAFAYDLGTTIVNSEGGSRPWNVGDRLLLFLVPDVGTVSSDISPPHLQVAEGEGGRYFLDSNRIRDADFTLDDVRREAR